MLSDIETITLTGHTNTLDTDIPQGHTYCPDRRDPSGYWTLPWWAFWTETEQETEYHIEHHQCSSKPERLSRLLENYQLLTSSEANCCPAMRVFNLLYLLLLLVVVVASVSSAPVSTGRPGKHPKTFPIQMSRLVGQVSVRIVHSHLKHSLYTARTEF